jgi:hypothetical protein
MKAVSKASKEVMNKIIFGLQIDKARKIDNAPGAFIPVIAEKIGNCEMGDIYSIAHYFKQNGDMMADPEMTFLKSNYGDFYPLSFKQDSLGLYQESVLFEGGKMKGIREKMQKEQTSFANIWMGNIKQQQGL